MIFNKAIKAWDEFWFSERSLLNLAVFRVILCGTLFLMALSRQFDVEKFYTNSGMLPRSEALSVMSEFFRPPFEWFFWSDESAFMIHFFLVAGLFALTLGIGGRLLNLFCWILAIGFLHRNYSLAFGADVIGSIFLFLMIGTQSCARLSLQNYFLKRKSKVSCDLATATFYRMIQIQLCIIYTYTGFEKLKGASWWDGTSLWTVFANSQMVVADFTWTRHFPLMIVGIVFFTILFEIYFAALIWLKNLRPWLLGAGVVFHFGIGFTMALFNFAMVMLSPYVLWMDESKIQIWLDKITGSPRPKSQVL